MVLHVKRTEEGKKYPLPKYETEGASGFDLISVEDVTIEPGETKLIPTGLIVEIPKGYEMQIRPRSGLSYKTGLILPNSPGTIDSDYRGEIKVILRNTGTYKELITKGMRIAQAVVCESYKAILIEAEDLSISKRGDKGFGSTGTK